MTKGQPNVMRKELRREGGENEGRGKKTNLVEEEVFSGREGEPQGVHENEAQSTGFTEKMGHNNRGKTSRTQVLKSLGVYWRALPQVMDIEGSYGNERITVEKKRSGALGKAPEKKTGEIEPEMASKWKKKTLQNNKG